MSKRTVHVTFGILLAVLLLTTVVLHAFTGLMTSNVARIAGATFSQLLLWGAAYGLCVRRPSTVLVGLGIAAVVVGRFTMPVIGWAILLVLIVVRFATAPARTALPDSGTGSVAE